MEPLKRAKHALRDSLQYVLVQHAEASSEKNQAGARGDAFFEACGEVEKVLDQVRESTVMKEKDLDEVSLLRLRACSLLPLERRLRSCSG